MHNDRICVVNAMMPTINEGFWKKYVMIYKIDEGILKIDNNL